MADDSKVLVRLQLLGGGLFNREAKSAGRSLEGVGAKGHVADAGLRATGRGADRAAGALDRARAASAGTMNVLRTMGAVAVPAVGLGLYAAGKATVQFDAAMRNVNSIAKLNETQFQRLSKSVIALGGPTAQQPKTLADGLYDLVSSGFNAAQSMTILRSSARAATAGLTTTEISTKAVAAVLNAYRLHARDAATVSDTLFQTVNRGVITFPELATTIGDVLPYAASLKVPLRDVGAAVSTMTKEGLSGSEATTRLKNSMIAFIKPGKDMAGAIQKTGFHSGEALIKAKGFQGALEAVIGTTKGSKQDVAGLFRNIRAIGGALALTGKNAASAHGDLRGFANVRGLTDKVLAEQSKSLAYQWHKLRAEATGIGIAIGRVVVPAAATALGLLTNLGHTRIGKDIARIPAAFAAGQQGSGQGYSGVAGRVADVSRHLPHLASARAGLTAGLSGKSSSETAGFAGVGAAAVKVGRALRDVGQGALRVGRQVLDAFKPAAPFLQNVLLPLLQGIAMGVIGGVVAAFKIAVPVIKLLATALGFVGKVAAPFGVVLKGIGAVIGFVFGGEILDALAVVGRLGSVFGKLGIPLRLVGGLFRLAAVPIRVVAGAVRGLGGVLRLGVAVMRRFAGGLQFVNRWLAFSRSGFGRALGAITNFASGVISRLEQMPGKAIGAIRSMFGGIFKFIETGGLPGIMFRAMRPVGEALVNGIVNVIKSAPGAIASAIMSILPGPVKGAAKKVLGLVGIATGGTVRAPGWAVVGERGPELARLPAGTTIYDHRQTARAMAPRPMPAMAAGHVIHISPVIPVAVQVERQTIHRSVFQAERQRLEAL